MDAKRVSILINEADEWHGRPLHLELLRALAKQGIAGATALRGVAGYTRSAGISTTSLVDAGGLLPLVMEFVDGASFREIAEAVGASPGTVRTRLLCK